MTTWYTTASPDEVERLVGAWPEAPIENEEVCGMLLDVAREQVIAYAPEGGLEPLEQIAADLASLGYDQSVIDEALAILDDAPVGIPVRYVYAQLQQAVNLWNAGRVSSGGDVGPEGYSFTPRPLDKTIRGIIRPVDGTPHVL